MVLRGLLVLAAAGASACAGIPDLTFVAGDAAASGQDQDASVLVEASAPVPVDGAAPPGDATMGDTGGGGPSDGALDAPVDPAPDSSPPGPDGSLACLPPGAPPGTGCCPDGNPCVGPACAECAKCTCAVGLYCCATETPAGKVKGTTCSASPTGAQCPSK